MDTSYSKVAQNSVFKIYVFGLFCVYCRARWLFNLCLFSLHFHYALIQDNNLTIQMKLNRQYFQAVLFITKVTLPRSNLRG